MYKRIISILILILFLAILIVYASPEPQGSFTTYGYFYLPSYYCYGAQGMDEFNEYNTHMEKADNQIEANKTSVIVSGVTVYNGESPTSWTDLDLSSIVGINSAMVILSFQATKDMDAISVRKNGDTEDYYCAAADAMAYGMALGHHDTTAVLVLICVTDTNGVIEWITENSETAIVKVIAYIK